jgi:hypothetical protein
MKEITQIMPAPGWRLIFCCRLDDDILFEEMPVVGWGVIHAHDEDGEEDYNEVDLLFFEQESGIVESVKDFFHSVEGGTHHILPPSQELTDELKCQWSNQLKRLLKREQRTRQERVLAATAGSSDAKVEKAA